LAGIDLDIPSGTFHMLLGDNGCGKSTLLKVLAGLLKADEGSFSIDTPYAFVFQNPDHQVVLPTVAADVAFGLGRYKGLRNEEVMAMVEHALDRVGLASFSNRPTSSLSGGQKQRVAIAGALAENPRVLLLDELTTFLDVKDQRNVLESVRRVVSTTSEHSLDNPVTALWVTHRFEELEYADGVSIMERGSIVSTGDGPGACRYLQSLGAKIVTGGY
jgi:energy-coupling factor transport system ATP-binding protein